MGGCFSRAAGRTAQANPQQFPGQSSQQTGFARTSTGRLVNPNLDTSIPDTFRAPPAPIPFSRVIGFRPMSPPVTQEMAGDNKNGGGGTVAAPPSPAEVANPGSADADQDREPSVKSDDVKESESKERTQLEVGAKKGSEVEISEPVKSEIVPIEEEDDVCPICMEEYDSENPKYITDCEHHFHLPCVLEWLERSETCPNCDQEMVIDPPTSS